MMVGPTTVPDRVIKAMNHSTISHRSKEYSDIQKRVSENLQKLFQTKNDVLSLTSSGTGAMEATLINCFSQNDKVVVPIIGNFSEQFAHMAEVYGLCVERVQFEFGETADVNKVMEKVNNDTKGVIIVHNESSTGVFNDLQAFGNAIKETNALLIADSVSGLGGLEAKMDEWNVDVLLTSSQKCLMSPPGLAFISLSDKAWDRVEKSKSPKYYFDLNRAREFQINSNQTPTTTATFTMLAVDEALKMIFEEGLENVYKRHIDNTRMIIDEVKNMGLELFAKDEKFASPTLTAIKAIGRSKNIVKELANHGIIINGGLAPLAEDTFRVGTMGYVSHNDVVAFLNTLKEIQKK